MKLAPQDGEMKVCVCVTQGPELWWDSRERTEDNLWKFRVGFFFTSGDCLLHNMTKCQEPFLAKWPPQYFQMSLMGNTVPMPHLPPSI